MDDLNLNDELIEDEPDDEELNELSGVDVSDEYYDEDEGADEEEADGDDPISAAWGYGEQSERRD